MLQQLPAVPTPPWLAELTPSTITRDPFPLTRVLEDSLYYPSAGFDGDPVKYLAGNLYSFIYVDYGHTREELAQAFQNPGFRGYRLLATRPVTEQELTPRGWRPILPTRADGNPDRYRAWGWIKAPFCSWSIFQRVDEAPATHGPFRFSLLYLCADGVAAFQALYLANAASPRAVAVIQPGHGFGGNWTDFENPERIFARSVLGNPHGRPQLLLYGGIGPRDFYRQPCWPGYSQLVGMLPKAGRGSIGIWEEAA